MLNSRFDWINLLSLVATKLPRPLLTCNIAQHSVRLASTGPCDVSMANVLVVLGGRDTRATFMMSRTLKQEIWLCCSPTASEASSIMKKWSNLSRHEMRSWVVNETSSWVCCQLQTSTACLEPWHPVAVQGALAWPWPLGFSLSLGLLGSVRFQLQTVGWFMGALIRPWPCSECPSPGR